jgi:hypothetical protein
LYVVRVANDNGLRVGKDDNKRWHQYSSEADLENNFQIIVDEYKKAKMKLELIIVLLNSEVCHFITISFYLSERPPCIIIIIIFSLSDLILVAGYQTGLRAVFCFLKIFFVFGPAKFISGRALWIKIEDVVLLQRSGYQYRYLYWYCTQYR